MITFKINLQKNALAVFLIFSINLFPNKLPIVYENPNFSGTWIINVAKSELGQAPLYTANKQISVQQSYDSIRIERLAPKTADENSEDYITIETLSLNGKPLEKITSSNRKRSTSIKWSEDRQKLIQTTEYSFQSNHDEIEYNKTEIWVLLQNGQILVVSQKVEYTTGPKFEIKTVFEKNKNVK